jgi:peroxiredoxin
MTGFLLFRAGSTSAPSAGQIVVTAPPFSGTGIGGESVHVAPGENGRCLLLFFCRCPNCFALAEQLRAAPIGKRPVDLNVYGVLRGNAAQAARFEHVTQFPGTLLADPRGQIHDLYQVGPCPNAWLVDQGGDVHFSRYGGITATELRRRVEKWESGL